MKKYYQVFKEIHYHTGLFISPFILIFAISVIFLNHKSRMDFAKDILEQVHVTWRDSGYFWGFDPNVYSGHQTRSSDFH